ncbi:uncharacterized protein BCR38DRAFT_349544 [Pseudomassariella vexata]|uniref:Uncharacterized protein n=1 Tax=Pseudomassariella vexata TaxID=1141098 RepID=A0A1Y2DPN3_9PEZI|nr:uncharacterized protein BCR38DRAFT_349544 [Pseudomassariella vexata]ORY60625.1 hypothetical protein BCR38DRAFT_349544 [Pseudomassariella vexata]
MLDPHECGLSFTSDLVNGHPSSFISPLALPVANQTPYFDESQLSSLPPGNHMHPSNVKNKAQRTLPQSQQHHLAPRRNPPNVREQRAASLSPSRYQEQTRTAGSRVTSPSLLPVNGNSLLSSPEQISSQVIALQLRRVTLQNRRLLENWEAERAHLEANRARAEEIYKEERAMMDDDRLIWAREEDQLLARIRQLEQENTELRTKVDQLTRGSGGAAPLGRGTDGALDPATHAGGVGFAGNAASTANVHVPTVMFRSPPDGVSPGPGMTAPESHPFVPLDPRMQSASPGAGSAESCSPVQERIPSIDVHELIPELEGIRIKGSAVQKVTFTDGASSVSPLAGSKKPSPVGSNNDSPSSRSKSSPAELTKEALQAPANDRLTMHAGHTPNHSLSCFPTVVSTEANNTAGSSGTSTPIRQPTSKGLQVGDDGASAANADVNGQHDGGSEDALPPLRPSDGDAELKGPLMIRNMPQHDEIFLHKLDEQLQTSLKEDNATPTVLKNGIDETHTRPLVPQQSLVSGADGTVEKELNQEENDMAEIPLRFKSSNNFGRPLGSSGSHPPN